jgi:hypothetical protein
MSTKIKNRPVGVKPANNSAKPLMLHEVAKQKTAANTASLLRNVTKAPSSGIAAHARHHSPRKAQSK